MSAIFLAALSALVWGSSDYCGGRASRHASAITVTVASQACGLPVIVLGLLLVPGRLVGADVAWGLGAGVAGLAGIVLLYRSLATGAMAVAAPITAVIGALIPLIVGLATQARPPAVALAGAGCAVIAIGLVSLTPSTSTHAGRSVIGLALGAGTMFGIFFTLLAQTTSESGMWPLAAVRVASISLGLVLLLARRGAVRAGAARGGIGPARVWLVLAGVGDVTANGLYLVAAQQGLLSVVAPIAALYPVSTVLLALTVDRERVRPVQIAGLGLAATALVLTSV